MFIDAADSRFSVGSASGPLDKNIRPQILRIQP
jgi:hypothetical protein